MNVEFIKSKSGIAIVGLITVFVFLYLFTGVFGGTFIGLTLNSNKSLQNGLVAHYTFDGEFETGTFEFGTSGATTTDPSSGADLASSIAVDESGYVYITGELNSGLEMYTAKINPLDGSLVWASTTNISSQDDSGIGIAIGEDGYVYVASNTDDEECTSQNEKCHRTFKMDPTNGDLIWYTTVNPSTSASGEHVKGISIDNAGFVYIAGTADDDACGGSGTDNCFYTYKLDPTSGSIIWATTTDPTDDNGTPSSIITDNAGDVYLTGYVENGTGSYCWVDTWCHYTIKIDGDNGDMLWATTTDTEGSNTAYDIAADDEGYVYVAGLSDGSDCPVFGGNDRCHYIFKIDGDNGDMVWSTTTDPSDGDDYAYGIDVGPQGYVYVTGSATSSACGGGSRGNCHYTYKVDPSDGSMIWATTTDPTANNDLWDSIKTSEIAVDQNSGYVYVTGYCGAGCGGAGDTAIYTFKLDPSDGSKIDTTSAGAIASLGKIAPGNIGQGIEFDGVDDYIDLENSWSDLITNSEATISVWIYPTGPSPTGDNDYYDGQGIISDPTSVFIGLFRANLSDYGVDGIWAGNWEGGHSAAGVTYETDRWTHITLVHSGGTLSIYKDGVFASSTASGNTSGMSGSVSIGTGWVDEPDRFFSGKIDDVRTYTRALSASEISRLYDLGATTKIAKTIDTNPDLENGLVGHWTFDGPNMDIASNTAEVLDISGSDIAGNWIDHATTTVPGKIGQAIDFDGTDDYINLGNDSSLEVTPPLTIATWIYMRTSAGRGAVETDSNRSQYHGAWLNVGSIVAFHYGDGSGLGAAARRSHVGSINIPTHEWHHVVGIIRGATDSDIYIDGALDTGVTYSGSGDAVAYSTSDAGIGNSSAGYFDGFLDDVRIYDRALSTSSVERLYHLGATTKVSKTLDTNPDLENGLVGHWTFDGKNMDISANTAEVLDRGSGGNDGDWLDHATTTTFGKIGQAIEFDGVDDYIDLGNPSVTGAYSLSIWFNREGNTAVTDNSNKLLFNKSGCCTNYPSIRLNRSGNNNVVVNHASDMYIQANTPFGTSTAGQWHHLGVTVSDTADEDTWYIYIDGVEDTSSRTNGSGPYEGFEADTAIGGGDGYSGNDNWEGKIDDVRLYNRALSTAEILRLYQMGN